MEWIDTCFGNNQSQHKGFLLTEKDFWGKETVANCLVL